jgi:hypothetical protein
MRKEQHARGGAVRKHLYIALIAAGAWLLAPAAGADENGPTASGQICMQKTFGTPVTSSNKLNCTANDIRLSRAISVNPDSCVRGETFDLTATFETIVTANARYDAGFFFRTDGGATAKGSGVSAAGQCSLSMLTPPPPGNDPAQDLDHDSCGDLNAGTYEVTFVIPDVVCAAAPGTNQLKLPNCTSWHSNQGTACDITEPFSTDDAGGFHPDTKSKCVCDDTFTVPVTVEDATIEVTKTADPMSVPEPGGTVSFTVNIKNLASNEDVIITSIIDNVFGNLGTTPSPYTPNDCPDYIGDTLIPGQDVSCSFSAMVLGDYGDAAHVDTVTVHASQPSNSTNDLFDSDDARVTFTDVFTAPTVSKTAQSTANCRVDATYQVVVSNNSALGTDTLDVNSLTDDMFGDLSTVHAAGGGVEEVVSTTCDSTANPFVTINPSGSYTCQFVGRILSSSSSCAIDHTNEVTANVTDDDGRISTPQDDAVVTVTATPPLP